MMAMLIYSSREIMCTAELWDIKYSSKIIAVCLMKTLFLKTF